MAKWIMDHISLDELKKEGKYPFFCAAFDIITSGDKYSLWDDVVQFYDSDYDFYKELAEKAGCDYKDARETNSPEDYFKNEYVYAWLINEVVEDTLREKYGTVENLKSEVSKEVWKDWEDLYGLINFKSKANDFFAEFYHKCITDACAELSRRLERYDDDDYEDLDESIIVKRAFEKLKEHNAKSEVRKIVESVFSSKLAEQK